MIYFIFCRFHNPDSEPSLKIDIIPPLSDNVQLSVDDYRNKLYELMTERSMSINNKPPTPRINHPPEIKSTTSSSISRTPSPKMVQSSQTTSNLYACYRNNNQNHIIATKSSTNLNRSIKSKLPLHVTVTEQKFKDPKFIKNSQRLTSNSITKTYIKSCFIEKNRPVTTNQQQQKVNETSKNNYFTNNNNYEKLNGKIDGDNTIMGCFGDNNSASTKIIRTNSQSSIRLRKSNYSTTQKHFNTYNQNHGIISASALIDLKSTIR